MKKLLCSILTLSLIFCAFSFVSCSQEAEEENWCPVGEPGDYKTVDENKIAASYELSSKKGYYGSAEFAPLPNPTKGWWYFRTLDKPVTVRFAKKTFEEINVKVKTSLVNQDAELISESEIEDLDGKTIPANSYLKISYESNQAPIASSEVCMEFYLYCE